MGVIFDQKLQWSDHIAHCILKSSKALNAIILLKRNFTTKVLMQQITSNFYSILYYNSRIWHLQSLKSNLKQKLLALSAKAIKTCMKYCTNDLSYNRIHGINNRATPEKLLLYIQTLFKLMLPHAPTCSHM